MQLLIGRSSVFQNVPNQILLLHFPIEPPEKLRKPKTASKNMHKQKSYGALKIGILKKFCHFLNFAL